MTFRDYLIQEYGQDWQGIQMDLLHEDYTEEMMNDYHDKLRDDFNDYLDDNDAEEIPE